MVTSTDFKIFNNGGDAAKKSFESPYCKFEYGLARFILEK